MGVWTNPSDKSRGFAARTEGYSVALVEITFGITSGGADRAERKNRHFPALDQASWSDRPRESAPKEPFCNTPPTGTPKVWSQPRQERTMHVSRLLAHTVRPVKSPLRPNVWGTKRIYPQFNAFTECMTRKNYSQYLSLVRWQPLLRLPRWRRPSIYQRMLDATRDVLTVSKPLSQALGSRT